MGIAEKSCVVAYAIYNRGDLFHFWGTKLQDSLIVSPPVNYLGAPHKRVLSSICLKK